MSRTCMNGARMETSKCQVASVVPEERHMTGTTAAGFSASLRASAISGLLSMEFPAARIGGRTAFVGAGKAMKREQDLRYYMHDGPKTFRFELAGGLMSEGAQRLEQDWRTARSVANG